MRAVSIIIGLLALGCSSRSVPPTSAPAAPAQVSEPGLSPAVPTLRLPRNFTPTSYTARLDIDPAKDAFSGSISIAGVIDQRSSTIWLHGRDLTISTASATKESSEIAIAVTRHGEDLLELRAAQPLEPGEWTVLLDYNGRFETTSSAGAFKQKVGDASYVYTQLEAFYARRVFPCLDEPDNKVPWQLTLDVPKRLIAAANTPIAREISLGADKKRVEFAVTKPLPTYLVAFAVGPFDIVDAGKSKNGTPIRVLALAKRGADAAYAVSTAPRILDATEAWFGTPYPYEKLDLVAIPMTTGFAAMENAGLITFTETLMLLDPRASTDTQRNWQLVAAHEIAHQWFGNLVTMAFWDDIWLNEGFASWIETKIIASLEPSWHELDDRLVTRNQALGSDSLVTARRIRQPIENSGDILNVFDGITYNKGASILNMFEGYLGEDVFQRAVREYLRAKAWGNATSNDFASALATTSAKPVIASAIASFLEQPGAPEITATVSCKGDTRVELSQQRYRPPSAANGSATAPWIVPVCIAYERRGKRAEACTLLEQATGSIALDTPSCPRWMMPNVDARGYYRNVYTPAQVAKLRDEAWSQLSWTERRALMFDVGTAATTGRGSLPLALSLVPKLLAGNERFTVSEALALPVGLDDAVPDDVRPKYERWLRKAFGRDARKAGFVAKDGESLDIEEIRADLLGAVAWTARDPALVAKAIEMSERWRDVPASLRFLVLAVAVDADARVFDRVLREIPSETDRRRRLEMYRAVSSVRDANRFRRALALVLDPAHDARETALVLSAGKTAATRAAAREFFRTNKDAIYQRLPKDDTADSLGELSQIFTAGCDAVGNAAERAAIIEFVRAEFTKFPGGAHHVNQNLEAFDQCIARKAVAKIYIGAWLYGIRLPGE